MSGTKDGSLLNSKSSTKQQCNAYATIALALWGLALGCSAVDAVLAYDRIKVLIFTGGLAMMDIAAAVLFSLFWFQSRKPPGALTATDLAVFAEHIWNRGYDKGCDDTEQNRPRLISTHGTGAIRGYYAATGDQADDHVS